MTSNICRANFNGGRTAQGNNRFQWDYGQILEISGITNLPDPFVAQFSNTPVLGTAKSTVGTGGRVEIPNEYFVSGQSIYCFIVLHTGEDDGRTVYIATIPVTKRPKPIDDPITPTQQSTIDTAIAALQAGVSRAEGFAQTATEQAGIATEAATTATEAATRAEGAVADVEAAATRAEQAADGAEASSTAAEASATGAETAKTAAEAAKSAAETAAASAEQSATDAGNYAGLAEEAETAAAASATAAEASATAAAASATQASGSATQAAQSASEAASSATAAQTSATNAEAAKTDAQAAQAAAEAAQASAEEAEANAQQSATTAEWYAERVERFLPTDTASGEIASFPDGADGVPMQSVVVTMEPVQDLHGQANPYPAGGGKNLLDYSGAAVNINSTEFKNISLTANQAYTFSYYGTSTVTFIGYVHGTSERVFTSGYRNTYTYTPETDIVIDLNCYNSSGVTSAANLFQMENGTTSTAYAPYSNVCPISGRTGAEIEHTGGNLFNLTSDRVVRLNGAANFTIDYSTPDRVIFHVTRMGSNYAIWEAFEVTEEFVGQTITFSRQTDKEARIVATATAADSWTSAAPAELAINISPATYTIKATDVGRKIGLRFLCASVVGDFYMAYPMLNFGSTATAYEPYTAETISVTFPSEAGTVYGGTLDVVGGELVVDRAMVDLGTLNWALNNHATLGQYFYADVYGLRVKRTGGYETTIYPSICTAFKCVSRNANVFVNGTYCFDGDAVNVTQAQFKASAYSDAASFKTAVTGQTLVYELATPITYSLTPQEVRTLLGTNNVWSDAGDTAVTYKADVQLYIDKRISALS